MASTPFFAPILANSAAKRGPTSETGTPRQTPISLVVFPRARSRSACRSRGVISNTESPSIRGSTLFGCKLFHDHARSAVPCRHFNPPFVNDQLASRRGIVVALCVGLSGEERDARCAEAAGRSATTIPRSHECNQIIVFYF